MPKFWQKPSGRCDPEGGTKMFDGIYLACQEKLKAEAGRKVMILISDGDDNLSLETLSGTLEMAQKSDVSIYIDQHKLQRVLRHHGPQG